MSSFAGQARNRTFVCRKPFASDGANLLQDKRAPPSYVAMAGQQELALGDAASRGLYVGPWLTQPHQASPALTGSAPAAVPAAEPSAKLFLSHILASQTLRL